MKKWCACFAVLLLAAASAGQARAEGFGLYEYSARGVALGGAMMARKPDPSAVAYNPALLTRLPGTHIAGGVSFISPRGRMRLKDPNTGETHSAKLKDSIWGLPHGYVTHQFNDDWFFGVGEFTRFGLGFEYTSNWPGRFNIYEVSLMSASINPNIAWRATDKLSLAAGLEFVYVSLDMRKRVATPAVPLPDGMVLPAGEVDSNIEDADAPGIGFNLAAHYQFNDQWAIGLQYRSQVRVHAFGKVKFENISAPAPVFDAMFHDGTAHSTVILPDSIAGGIAWSPLPELSIEAGAIWTRWSTFRHLNIHLPEGTPNSLNNKHWKDAWRLNVGVEYTPLDWLTLRAGYVWDQSPMTDKYQDYLVPTDGRDIYSVGVGFHWDAWTVDLAYAYIDARSRSYDRTLETNVLDSKVTQGFTNILSLSVGYEF